jgi:hypothetical protein
LAPRAPSLPRPPPPRWARAAARPRACERRRAFGRRLAGIRSGRRRAGGGGGAGRLVGAGRGGGLAAERGRPLSQAARRGPTARAGHREPTAAAAATPKGLGRQRAIPLASAGPFPTLCSPEHDARRRHGKLEALAPQALYEHPQLHLPPSPDLVALGGPLGGEEGGKGAAAGAGAMDGGRGAAQGPLRRPAPRRLQGWEREALPWPRSAPLGATSSAGAGAGRAGRGGMRPRASTPHRPRGRAP